jgi:AmiR/NasT family two-component response regulator
VSRGAAPPGWPPGVLPPGAPGWERSVVGWLLDQSPGDYRSYEELRRHPRVLAALAARHAAASHEGAVEALAGIRAELTGQLAPEVVEAAVSVCEREVTRLRTLVRQVEAVAAALRGDRRPPRL